MTHFKRRKLLRTTAAEFCYSHITFTEHPRALLTWFSLWESNFEIWLSATPPHSLWNSLCRFLPSSPSHEVPTSFAPSDVAACDDYLVRRELRFRSASNRRRYITGERKTEPPRTQPVFTQRWRHSGYRIHHHIGYSSGLTSDSTTTSMVFLSPDVKCERTKSNEP